jgi:hypothetical protein
MVLPTPRLSQTSVWIASISPTCVEMQMTRSLEAEAAPEGRLQEAGPRPKGLMYLKLHLAVAMGICLPSTSRSEIAIEKTIVHLLCAE